MSKKFINVFIVVAIFWNVMTVKTIQAQAPDRTLQDYSVQELISHFAVKYNVSETKISKTLYCESWFVPQQSRIIDKQGQREDSWGIAQIHLPSHPSITREQAMNNVFAVEFTAKEFAKGNASKWSCYKKIYGV